jgi:hypothetical protein
MLYEELEITRGKMESRVVEAEIEIVPWVRWNSLDILGGCCEHLEGFFIVVWRYGPVD